MSETVVIVRLLNGFEVVTRDGLEPPFMLRDDAGHESGPFVSLAQAESAAQGTEARRAETVKHGSVHDGPVAKPCAQTPSQEP